MVAAREVRRPQGSPEVSAPPRAAEIPAPQWPMRLRGVDVLVRLTVDAAEHRRRRQVGLGPVTDRAVLERLCRPEEAAVPSLPAPLRVAVPPLRVDLATVVRGHWRVGLEAAMRFGPYCARRLVLAALPPDAGTLLLQAAYFGVGVGLLDGQVLLDPAPFQPMPRSAAGWAFAESAYEQLLEQSDLSAIA